MRDSLNKAGLTQMKIIMKVFIAIIILFIPIHALAMTPVSEPDLSDVFGQAGVNINADLTMNLGIGTIAWGDATGVDAYASLGTSWSADGGAGYVGVTGFNITNLRIKARETDTFGTGYNTTGTAGAAPDTYNTLYLKPITIDVATDPMYIQYNGATYVRFGLGSIQTTLDVLSFRVALGPTTALAEELGTVNLGPLEIFINPRSYVDIYNPRAGARPGVYFTMKVVIDQLNLDHLSWGDSDGLGGVAHAGTVTWISSAAQSGGYIGLHDLSIGGPIIINGTVAIDIVTSAAGIYAHGSPGTPVTVCHILFPSLFNVRVTGPITANVNLDGTASLDGVNAGTLGSIYLSNINIDIAQRSWVDIWAH